MAEGDIVGIRCVGRYQDQNIVQTLHYEIVGQTISDHMILQVLSDAWDAKFSAAVVARSCDDYTLVGVKAFSLSGNNKRPGITTVGDAGTVVADGLPASLCRCITLYTNSTNFRRRGRWMMSGTCVTMVDDQDGSINIAERLALGSLVDLFIDTIVSDDESFAPILPPAGALPKEPITAALARVTPAYVTSRRIRGFAIG